MQQTRINSISQFMTQSGLKYRVFDMGRRVTQLQADTFVLFERGQQVYPYPFQRKALMGIIFWHPAQRDKRYVWFLNFPLDEQGLLIPQNLDSFLELLLARVGESMLAAAEGEKLDGILQDNPYVFTPSDTKMAAFNARARESLNLPPSQYYPAAQAYFVGQAPLENWQTLRLQGIADVAMRATQGELILELIAILPRLPEQPFESLCQFLEHATPPAGLVEVLAQKLFIELQNTQPKANIVIACLRGASNTPATGLLEEMVKKTLKHPLSEQVEILAVMCGRLWPVLKNPSIAQQFVERLAKNEAGQSGFSQLLADILFVPGMRDPVMQALRSPQRSEALIRAVGMMFGTSQTVH